MPKTTTTGRKTRGGGTTTRKAATGPMVHAPGRGISAHPIIVQLNAAVVAAAEHFRGAAWEYASLIIVPPNPGDVGAPPAITIRVDNPAHTSDG